MKKLLSASAPLLWLAATAVQAAAPQWQNVRLGGGGGFVPGIVFHPATKGVAYARTDIGGLYRLNAADDSWTAVTDSITDHARWHNWGVDAVALDPADDKKVYAAFGLYTNSWDGSNGQIGRSADRGQTWTFTDLPFKVGGNMPGRGTGERLAVDPANPDVLYFGARSGKGLWKSTNGGASFAKVASFTGVGTYAPQPGDSTGLNSDIQGLTFVTFDSTSPKVGGATSRIFVGTADNSTASLYVSEDAGATWAAIKNQPKKFFPHKGKLSPAEKALYISYADGTGPYDGTNGAVYRYDIAAGTFKDITPKPAGDGALNFGFGGLALDAQKPGTLVVASLNSWWPDAQIFRSTDSGATWSPIWTWAAYPEMNLRYKQDVSKAPWIGPGFLDIDTKDLGWMIEALEIDPHDSNHWLYGTGLTLFGGHDLTKWDTASEKVTIQSLADGIEETSVQDVASVPGGSELLAATGDVGGFTFADAKSLDSAPKKNWLNPKWATNVGVDYAGAANKNVVRIGNSAGTKQIAVSADGGDTWKEHPGADTNANGGTVAISADGKVIVWSAAAGGVLRSQDQGAFSRVASLAAGAVVASDKQKGSVFYGGAGAKFYVSTDAGSSFAAAAGKLGSATAIRDIAAHPTKAGEVWVSTDVGVFHSTDSGATFTATSSSLTNTFQVALGVGAGSNWNVYAFGHGDKGARLYGSGDGGKTWTDIQGDVQGFGTVDSGRLAGSGNVAGLVYVGTNGRGVFRSTVSLGGGSSPSPDPSTTTSVPPPPPTTTTSQPAPTTTLVTSTTSKRADTTTSASGPKQTHFGQCGGQGATPVECEAPYTCQKQNDWYHQCL